MRNAACVRRLLTTAGRSPMPYNCSNVHSRQMSVLDAIGNTSLVRLQRIVPDGCSDIFVKLEWQNPTGSMKDRMAFGAISKGESQGRLKQGDTIVEYTGGSTGASLVLVCTAKGYPIR